MSDTGIYGYPLRAAAEVALATVRAFTVQTTSLREVIFCCYSSADLQVYQELLGAGSIYNAPI